MRGLLQESKRKSRHDFESVLDMQTAFQKRTERSASCFAGAEDKEKRQEFPAKQPLENSWERRLRRAGERWQRQLAVDEFHLSANCLSGEKCSEGRCAANTSEGNGRKNPDIRIMDTRQERMRNRRLLPCSGRESHQQRCAEVQPAGAADFVFNFLAIQRSGVRLASVGTRVTATHPAMRGPRAELALRDVAKFGAAPE